MYKVEEGCVCVLKKGVIGEKLWWLQRVRSTVCVQSVGLQEFNWRLFLAERSFKLIMLMPNRSRNFGT
jgi:hypothetical protein